MVVALAILSAAPGALAEDPLNEPVCVLNECVGAGECIENSCVPRGCEPAGRCSAEAGPNRVACATNVTIDGRTCALYAGAAFERDAVVRADASAAVSNGSVHAEHLDNTWVSPGADVSLGVAGHDLGRFFVYAYRSDILTEGPRGGPYGRLAPSEHHTWTEFGVVAGHAGGPTGGGDVIVGVELLDLVPEGCFVRFSAEDSPEVSCPRVPVYLPLLVLV